MTQSVQQMEHDVGLRKYMIGVYQNMGVAMVVTGLVALFVSNMAGGSVQTLTGFGEFLYTSWFKWILVFSPIAYVMFFFRENMDASSARMHLWLFSALVGTSLSAIFLVYTDTSIARIFFVTAAMFGGLSLWAYTTEKDISGWIHFLTMGLIAVFLLWVINMFIGSAMLTSVFASIGVFVFSGIIAWQTQDLKNEYCSGTATETSSVLGALTLYVQFLNLFQSMLWLFGDRE